MSERPDQQPQNDQLRARLHRALRDAFSVAELNKFALDYFPIVRDDFAPEMRKSIRVDMIVTHALRRGRVPDLIAALKRERPYDSRIANLELPAPRASAPPPPLAKLERNPRQIFISHANEDAKFVHRLAADLRERGWQTWIAPDSIRLGEKWVDAINRGLAESGVFLLVLTEAAINSRWVEIETNAAIGMETRRELRFIPIVLETVDAPPLWQSYQWISFEQNEDAGLAALLHELDPQTFAASNSAAENSPVKKARVITSSEPETEPHEKQIDSFIHPITGKEMVRVPAGEFLYGDDKETVYLDEFWIDKTPVTNAAYKRFLDANPGHRVPWSDRGWLDRVLVDRKYEWDERSRTYPEDKADHPVVLVSWHDAQAYAKWAGAQLPAEEQWEKAARGVDGRRYPWGDEWRSYHCNTKEVGIGGTSSVGQFSPQGDSPYGCVDMAGNVWEWTVSWYDENETRRGLRGGSFYDLRDFARAAYRYRNDPVNRLVANGFRLVAVRRPPSHLAP